MILPPTNPKNQDFKKWKNFTHVYQKSQSYDVRSGVIWSATYIWSATDRIFCHYRPFFALSPPYGPRKSKFEKMKKTLEDVILQVFTINDSHMIYGFSDVECNRQIVLSFWTIFCPFTLPLSLPNNPENQHFEKLKKAPGGIIILKKCTKNHNHMLYCSLDIARNGYNCYFSFWAFFFTLLPL